MLGCFLVLGFFVLLIHYLYADVALTTPDFLRLPGYAKLHLGEWGKKLASLSLILGSIGSLLAYLIVGGEFLNGLFSDTWGDNVLFYTIIYFLLGTFSIFIGVKLIAKIEFWGMIGFFLAIIFLFFKSFPLLKIENLLVGNLSPQNLFLPFGPIIFSLWGATMIPEIEEMLIGNKKNLKKVVLTSVLIAAVIYLFFIIFVLGVSGKETSESALTGLAAFLGKDALMFGFFFGFLATFTSFIAVGINLKNSFHYDFKVPQGLSWFLVCFLPLFLYLVGMQNFITIIGLVGSVMLVIEGLLILLMYRKIKIKLK
jgi:amino acid permease